MTGMLGHIGLAKEATWGTAVAAAHYVEALSESIITTVERFDTRNVIGGFYEPDDNAGVVRHAGDVVAAAHPQNVGHFLMAAMGINSVSIVATNPTFYATNEFTPATTLTGSLNPLPSYTFEVLRDSPTTVSSAFQFAGVQVGAVELGIAPNQDLRLTAALLAKSRAFIAKTTPTFPGSPVQPFAFDTASISIAGSAVTRVEALSWSFDNQLEGVPTLNNDTEIAKIRRSGAQMVGLNGTLEFEDHTDYLNFVNQTEQQIIATFTRADSFQIAIDLPRTVFTEFPVQIAGRDRITVDFSMKGRYHTGSANAVKVTLTTVNTF